MLSIVSISKIFDSVSPAVCLCIQAARISHSILNVPFYFYAKYFSDLLNFTVRHENYIIKHGALRSNEFGFQRTFLCYTILSLRMSIFIIVNSRIWRQTVMMKNTNSVASNYKYFEIHWTSAIWKIPEKQTTIAKRECRGFQSTNFFESKYCTPGSVLNLTKLTVYCKSVFWCDHHNLNGHDSPQFVIVGNGDSQFT